MSERFTDTLLKEPVGAQFVTTLGNYTERLEALIALARQPERDIPLAASQGAQLNSNGAATFQVYEVAAGFDFYLTRCVVEAATFDATTPYTPASPYSHADFWLGLFRSPNPRDVDQGQLIDFTPTTDGQQGLPNVAEYTQPGPLIRGGQFLVCYVTGGPASRRVSVNYEGYIRRSEV